MFGPARASLAVLCTILGLLGCSSDGEFTTDVAGNYTVAITNEESSCSFQGWQEGNETSGIELSLTQDGSDLHGTMGGLTGSFFTLVFGSSDFDGTIHGNTLELTNYGSRAATSGNCVYTYNATVKGTQTGDSIAGTITYAAQTNGNPDCDAVECSASQKFSGSRPPK